MFLFKETRKHRKYKQLLFKLIHIWWTVPTRINSFINSPHTPLQFANSPDKSQQFVEQYRHAETVCMSMYLKSNV